MKRTCPNGHIFEKSSDCPVCPICEKAKLHNPEFPKLGAPALRALANAGITRLKDLTHWTEADLLRLHGIGPSAIPKLRQALKDTRLQFRKSEPLGKK